ncbi:tetratricopeptide repeat protein [Sphingomicrobium lutaoense]|uniref:Tetratricopeptide (TPR) repeat protein n=1 Tax=Sphingomicrobium lutaoense TaxID=515949 RepID=A0A839Z769_9SPHN|nr:hypothetical protein [Sphingomicrobium lutaoense]MBB3764644.1 tetratricopeptide (TPR) repeat protein [Sphingomicrobium lutaoense]
MIPILVATLLVQSPQIAVPGELLNCGTDRSAETLLCRAVAAQRDGRHADSAAAFEDAASLSAIDDLDQSARALVAAGNMWLLADRPEAAANVIDRALALNRLDPVQRGLALMDRARASVAMLEPKVAEGFATEAQALIPEDPFVWYFTSGLALYAGDLERAKEDIDRALALAPDAPEVLLRAAAIAEARGEEGPMRAYLEDAVRHGGDRPAGASARMLLEQLSEPPVGGDVPPEKKEAQ